MKYNFRTDLNYVDINGHKLHIFRAGDGRKPKLVFMSGSGTAAPMYDFKILYEKLIGDFRIIVIEKFGYGYSDLYEGSCKIDDVIAYQRKALESAGEKPPYVLLPHSMSGLEAIRWKQLYPEDVAAIIGLDMATPITYMEWSDSEVEKRIGLMKKFQKLNRMGLLFWYPLSRRGLDKNECRELKLLKKRNLMNDCYINEARAVQANAKVTASSEMPRCPMLMFVSDGKQVSANWRENERKYAAGVGAETVFLDCGHYIHYFESERISTKIREFISKKELFKDT